MTGRPPARACRSCGERRNSESQRQRRSMTYRAATSPSVPQLRRAPQFGGPTLTPNDDGAAISPAHGNITSPRPSRPQLPLLPDLPQDVGPSPQLRISPISPRGRLRPEARRRSTATGHSNASNYPPSVTQKRVRRPIGGTQPRVAILQNPRTYESPEFRYLRAASQGPMECWRIPYWRNGGSM